jgi:CO dehydrogenase maturation factor
MEAGVEHLGRKTAEAVDLMIIVVEPGLKSLETAERIKKLANDIGIYKILCVVNKVSNVEEEEFVKSKLEELGVEVIGTIPRDPLVVKADMDGKALIEYPESEALKSIQKIATQIMEINS